MLGNKTRVLLNRYDFSAGFYQVETEHTVAEEDNTGFGADAMTFEPGLSADKLMLRGYFSGAQADTVYREFQDRMGADGVGADLAILIDTDDANCVALAWADGWGQMLKLALAAPKLITFEVNTAAAANLVRGLRLFDGVITTTGAKATVDFGAAGTDGGWLFCFIQALAPGGANVELTLSSATTQAGTYTTRATLNFTSRGCVVVPVAGGIGRWLRLTVTDLGGATSTQIVAIAAVKGVTY